MHYTKTRSTIIVVRGGTEDLSEALDVVQLAVVIVRLARYNLDLEALEELLARPSTVGRKVRRTNSEELTTSGAAG